jgi:hypothetical protein
MKRAVSLAVVLGLVVAASSACDDPNDDRYAHASSSHANCRAQTSCGACTPVLGCGWCFIGTSTGVCVDGPYVCPSDATGWTWDPPGCDDVEAGAPDAAPHVIAEAGIGD